MPCAGIAHRQHDVASGLDGLVVAGIVCVELRVGSFERELPAVRHGVAGIEGQVHDDLLDLPGIGLHRAEIACRYGQDFNVLSNQPAQQGIQIHHDVIQIDDARRKHLLAAEGEQLAGDAEALDRRQT